MKTSAPNIVIVNDFAHINGGAGQVALFSAIALADRGYSVSVFSAVLPVMAELRRADLRVIVTGQQDILSDPHRIRAAAQGIWNFKAAREMAKLLDTLDPANTIVHLHGWTKALSSSIARVVIRKGFKTVCTLHDYFLACPNGGFFNYRTHEICRLHPLSARCVLENCDSRSYPQKLWRVGRQIVQARFARMPSAIRYFITVSGLSESILTPFLPQHAEIYRIENPVMIPRAGPADVTRNQAFLFIGRLSREKGAGLFARAAQQVGVDCLFVGEGECRAAVLDACPSAKITGWLPNDRVYEYLRQARALVLPSLGYETQGLAVAEAAAAGVPAIVSDTSAAREMVEDGVTGLWFRGGDESDLASKIRVLQDAAVAGKLGAAAYGKYWSEPLTIDAHLGKLEHCYQTILKA